MKFDMNTFSICCQLSEEEAADFPELHELMQHANTLFASNKSEENAIILQKVHAMVMTVVRSNYLSCMNMHLSSLNALIDMASHHGIASRDRRKIKL